MKAHQLNQGGAYALTRPIRPSEALVPQKIVQNGGLNGQPCGRQII
jgi:hypothetical protein